MRDAVDLFQRAFLASGSRETEALIRKLNSPAKKAKPMKKDPDITSLEQRLSETLGAQVNIRQQGKGKGKLEIRYNSLDELDGILEHIN